MSPPARASPAAARASWAVAATEQRAAVLGRPTRRTVIRSARLRGGAARAPRASASARSRPARRAAGAVPGAQKYSTVSKPARQLVEDRGDAAPALDRQLHLDRDTLTVGDRRRRRGGARRRGARVPARARGPIRVAGERAWTCRRTSLTAATCASSPTRGCHTPKPGPARRNPAAVGITHAGSPTSSRLRSISPASRRRASMRCTVRGPQPNNTSSWSRAPPYCSASQPSTSRSRRRNSSCSPRRTVVDRGATARHPRAPIGTIMRLTWSSPPSTATPLCKARKPGIHQGATRRGS